MPELPANWHEQLATVGVAALAALFGALIGFEREVWGKPAGLRTHALIAFACALFVEVGRFLIDFYAAGHPREALRIEVFGVLSGSRSRSASSRAAPSRRWAARCCTSRPRAPSCAPASSGSPPGSAS